MRLDVGIKQGVHQATVVTQSSFVDVVGGAIGKNPRPGYGEAVMRHLELPQHGNILIHFVVTVAGDVAVIVIEHSERRVGKPVPNAQTFSIGPPSSFDLEAVSTKLQENTSDEINEASNFLHHFFGLLEMARFVEH